VEEDRVVTPEGEVESQAKVHIPQLSGCPETGPWPAEK